MREAILQDPNAESKPKESVREGRLPRRNKRRKRCTRMIERTKSGSDLTLLKQTKHSEEERIGCESLSLVAFTQPTFVNRTLLQTSSLIKLIYSVTFTLQERGGEIDVSNKK